ncbi:MAG TPA: ABC transporter substrate-binding protein [Kofleriaceae bacterium]|nr:ABC transporter substrate-binding protein [Kofleriaceae bacterium]
MLWTTVLFAGGCKSNKDAKKEPDKGSGSAAQTAQGSAQGSAQPGGSGAAPAGAVELAITCGAVGKEQKICKEGVAAWEQKTGNKVKVVSVPASSSEQLALAQQLLAAGASDVDVFNIDVVWPGILGTFFLDLKEYSKGAEKEHFEAIVANNTIDGKLVAMPWFTDAGVLYYRKDLLEKHKEKVPTTWEELAATAKKIQDAERKAGHKEMWGYVFQGNAYEGLTCNALEWVASHGGGTVIDAQGKVTIDNPDAAAALETAASWIGTISPPGVLSYQEGESHGIFLAGDAVFMRNWPYAYGLAQEDKSPVKDKVGISVLPKGAGAGARSAAALGGWNLAVSKFSKHPKEAAELALYLTSPEEQKRRAIAANLQPTIVSLYQDKDVVAANPLFTSLVDTFKAAVPRPATATKGKYNRVSTEFWNAAHAVLSKQAKAKDSLADLKGKLEGMSRGGTW